MLPKMAHHTKRDAKFSRFSKSRETTYACSVYGGFVGATQFSFKVKKRNAIWRCARNNSGLILIYFRLTCSLLTRKEMFCSLKNKFGMERHDFYSA
jgi:hypothetical protein